MTRLLPQQSRNAKHDALSELIDKLPPLPSVVRYYDDFDEELRSIGEFRTATKLDLVINGSTNHLDFSRFGSDYDLLAKHLFYFFITNDLSLNTAYNYLLSLLHIDRGELVAIVSAGPLKIKPIWATLSVNQNLTIMSYVALKGLLRFLAKHALCGWSVDYMDFQGTLPVPHKDKYPNLRDGGAFLSTEQEARVVRHLDSLMSDTNSVSPESIRQGGMLLCSFVFGMRPIQVASLRMRDVRIWAQSDESGPSVHLTFKKVKQRTQSSAHPLTRKVKHEWAPIIIQQFELAQNRGCAGDARFFDVTSSAQVARAIATLATCVVGDRVTATDLRHTAAQRLVDAGASQEELAAFLGHTDSTTGLIYFETSANQSERVNAALGISEIYRRVAKIAHDKFISPEELGDLKEDQQVAGAPHGIPIAGIGGCATGQPTCPYNPITSCYGCRKFLPVTDLALHKKVLEDMRGVVIFFEKTSRGDTSSPAYLQLRRTISDVQGVITELEVTPNA